MWPPPARQPRQADQWERCISWCALPIPLGLPRVWWLSYEVLKTQTFLPLPSSRKRNTTHNFAKVAQCPPENAILFLHILALNGTGFEILNNNRRNGNYTRTSFNQEWSHLIEVFKNLPDLVADFFPPHETLPPIYPIEPHQLQWHPKINTRCLRFIADN